jgi:AraC family transcriptional regulator of adaptative response / DNA-3-methyladenine glycosylase II
VVLRGGDHHRHLLPPELSGDAAEEREPALPSAAAVQQAGFRACRRCRPDASPGSPQWNERADLVARAMRLIADGVVDRDGVPGLAAKLGYSVRQIQRQLLAELGAGPLAIARAQTARLLVETTPVPLGLATVSNRPRRAP